MKKILFILTMFFITLIHIEAQSYTMQRDDCNITFTNISTNKIWYSFDLYQAVINYNPTNDLNQFSIGDNLRTNIFSKSQIINFASIPIIIDSFYSWKTDCINLHKGSGGVNSLYLYSENYDAPSFIQQYANGLNSVAIGGGGAIASGNYSFACGNGSSQGIGSFSGGQECISSGALSFSIGENNLASGETSLALGRTSVASGNHSKAIGNYTSAKSYSETALGTENTDYIPNDTIDFNLTDRLLVVGNGNKKSSDAFTILKNAKVGIDIDNFETTSSLAKLQVDGLISTNIQSTAINIDLDSSNITQTILVDNSISTVNIKLPNPTTCFFNNTSIRLTIKQTTSNISLPIKIFPYSSEKIDNQDVFTFSKEYQSVDLVTDGTNWWIVSNNN